MHKYKHIFIPLGLSLFAAYIYLYTAPPFMLWLDALNFITASVALGINNPPAPLYVFISHFFTLLPFGSVIFRLQLFSVLSALSSLLLLYRILIWIAEQISSSNNKSEKVNEKSIILSGIFGVLTLGFSYQFWSQAQNTEKWILECLFLLLILYLVTVIFSVKKYLYPGLIVIFFLLGLSTGIDLVVLSFFPSVMFVLWKLRTQLNIKKLLLLFVTAFLGVIIVYSYLPIMSSQNPFVNFGRPTDLWSIWNVATGQWTSSSNAGFIGSVNVFFSSAWRFLTMIWISFTPLLLPFILLGGWYLWKKKKLLFWLLFLIILTNFFLSSIYLSGNQESWYLLPHISFAIFAGVGYFWLINKITLQLYAYLLFFISLVPLIYWWPSLDRHEWRLTEDYIYNVYTPIKEPAIFIGDNDLYMGASHYVYGVSKLKPNVTPVLSHYLYLLEPYRKNLLLTTDVRIPNSPKSPRYDADEYSAYINEFIAMNLPKYNIYIDFPALHAVPVWVRPRPDGTPSLRIDEGRFKLIHAGLVEKVAPKESIEQPDLTNFNFRFSNGYPSKKPNLIERSYKEQLNYMTLVYAYVYANMGDSWLQRGEIDLALNFYQRAYAMTPNNLIIVNKLEAAIVKKNSQQ